MLDDQVMWPPEKTKLMFLLIKEVEKNSQDEGPDPHAIGTKLGSYVFDKSLGKGTFGKVKLATHTLTNEHVSATYRFTNRAGSNQNLRKGSHQG